MEYEIYKNKLLDIKNSLEELKQLLENRNSRYIDTINEIYDMGDNEKYEIIRFAENKTSRRVTEIRNQICDLDDFMEKAIYKNIFVDSAQNAQKVSPGYNEEVVKVEDKHTNKFKSEKEMKTSSLDSNIICNSENSDIYQGFNDDQKREIEKFIDAYVHNKLATYYGEEYKLSVVDECAKELSKRNIDDWDNIENKDRIALHDTQNTNQAYYAYKIKGCRNELYFAIPASGQKFTPPLVVRNAFLTYFELPRKDIGSSGRIPKLIRPAVLIKENNEYRLYGEHKGLLKF